MSSSASLTSGGSGKPLKRGALGSSGRASAAVSIVLIESGVIAAISAASSAEPVSVGVVPFVILRNFQFGIPVIIQTEGWSERVARIRRDQTTSFVAAGRGATEAEIFFENRKHSC